MNLILPMSEEKFMQAMESETPPFFDKCIIHQDREAIAPASLFAHDEATMNSFYGNYSIFFGVCSECVNCSLQRHEHIAEDFRKAVIKELKQTLN